MAAPQQLKQASLHSACTRFVVVTFSAAFLIGEGGWGRGHPLSGSILRFQIRPNEDRLKQCTMSAVRMLCNHLGWPTLSSPLKVYHNCGMLVEDQHDPRKGSNCANPTSCTSKTCSTWGMASRVNPVLEEGQQHPHAVPI